LTIIGAKSIGVKNVTTIVKGQKIKKKYLMEGFYLRITRHERKMSREPMAKVLGASDGFVSRIELGYAKLPTDRIKKYLTAVGGNLKVFGMCRFYDNQQELNSVLGIELDVLKKQEILDLIENATYF